MARNSVIAKKARKLKKAGWQNKAISAELGITSSTVSRWCTEIPNRFSKVIDQNQKKRQLYYSQDQVNIKTMSPKQTRVFSALLYWCEGSKYPSSNRICFTSCDPDLQKLFISLIRKGFDLDNSKFRIWLQLHTDHSEKDIKEFWSKKLNVPTNQFIKPKITKKNGGKYRTVYRGTFSLRYNDYSILLRLMGIYKRFAKEAISRLI